MLNSAPPRILAFLQAIATDNTQYGDGSPMQADARALLAVLGETASREADLQAEVNRFRVHALNEQSARKSLETADIALHRQLAEAIRHGHAGWSRWENSQRMCNSLSEELAVLNGAFQAVN